MLSSTMSDGGAGGERLLPGRRLRRQHRLAHRGRHAGDRRPRQPAARHAGLRGLAAAGAQRAASAVRLAAHDGRVPRHPGSLPVRRRPGILVRAGAGGARPSSTPRSTGSTRGAPAADPASPAARRFNAAQRTLARLLIPVNYSADGAVPPRLDLRTAAVARPRAGADAAGGAGRRAPARHPARPLAPWAEPAGLGIDRGQRGGRASLDLAPAGVRLADDRRGGRPP